MFLARHSRRGKRVFLTRASVLERKCPGRWSRTVLERPGSARDPWPSWRGPNLLAGTCWIGGTLWLSG
jgi:hypothetical protein